VQQRQTDGVQDLALMKKYLRWWSLPENPQPGFGLVGHEPFPNDVFLARAARVCKGAVQPDQDREQRVAVELADDRDDVVGSRLPISELAPSQRDLRVVEHRRK